MNGAEQRIDLAIDRLQSVIEHKINAIRAAVPDADDRVARAEYDSILQDIDALKLECSQLRQELQTADEAQAHLRAAGRALVDDLDRTIGQIDALAKS